MKTQITKQQANVVALQPLTAFHKEDRMKNHSSSTLKLAILFAMVITMALSAIAEDEVIGPPTGYQNPLQVALKEWYPANQSAILTGLYPGGGSFSTPGAVVFDGSNIWVEHVVSGGPNRVDKLQASDGKFIASYALGAAGTSGAPSAFDGVNIWSPDHSPSSTIVFRTRAADGSTIGCSLGSAATYPDTVAFDGQYVWVSTNSGYVVKLNPNETCPTTLPICSSPYLGSRIYSLAFDGHNMWATAVDANQVIKLSSSCTVAATVTGIPGPIGIVFDGTNLWTANQSGNSISRITGGVLAGTYALGYTPWVIAYDGANVWITDPAAGRVSKMLATSPYTLSSYPACGSASSFPLGLAFDGAHMWVGCEGINKLGKM